MSLLGEIVFDSNRNDGVGVFRKRHDASRREHGRGAIDFRTERLIRFSKNRFAAASGSSTIGRQLEKIRLVPYPVFVQDSRAMSSLSGRLDFLLGDLADGRRDPFRRIAGILRRPRR